MIEGKLICQLPKIYIKVSLLSVFLLPLCSCCGLRDISKKKTSSGFSLGQHISVLPIALGIKLKILYILRIASFKLQHQLNIFQF